MGTVVAVAIVITGMYNGPCLISPHWRTTSTDWPTMGGTKPTTAFYVSLSGGRLREKITVDSEDNREDYANERCEVLDAKTETPSLVFRL